MGTHEDFGQLAARIAAALDYDNSSPASLGNQAILWVPGAGKFAPRTVVMPDDTRLSDARTPTAHAHAIGDLPVAASGASSTTALVRADDARLSNARTPAGHAASHASGGSDQLTPAAIGAAASGHTHAMTPARANVRAITSASSPVTAVNGDLLVIDAAGGNVTLNPPASPAAGDAVEIVRIDTASTTVRWTGAVQTETDAVIVGQYTATRLTWTGSVWIVSATNAGTPSPQAIGAMPVETGTAVEVYNSGNQSHGNGQNVPALFNTTTRSTPLVTIGAQGTGTKFTLNRAGVWVGYATARWPAATNGEAYLAIVEVASGALHGAQGAAFGGQVATRSSPISAWLAAGTELYVVCYQSSGGTLTLGGNQGWMQWRMAWVHD